MQSCWVDEFGDQEAFLSKVLIIVLLIGIDKKFHYLQPGSVQPSWIWCRETWGIVKYCNITTSPKLIVFTVRLCEWWWLTKSSISKVRLGIVAELTNPFVRSKVLEMLTLQVDFSFCSNSDVFGKHRSLLTSLLAARAHWLLFCRFNFLEWLS